MSTTRLTAEQEQEALDRLGEGGWRRFTIGPETVLQFDKTKFSFKVTYEGERYIELLVFAKGTD